MVTPTKKKPTSERNDTPQHKSASAKRMPNPKEDELPKALDVEFDFRSYSSMKSALSTVWHKYKKAELANFEEHGVPEGKAKFVASMRAGAARLKIQEAITEAGYTWA